MPCSLKIENKQRKSCFPVIILGSMFLFLACQNDINEVKQLTHKSDLPEIKVNHMHTVLTDSGRVRVTMEAPVMQRFSPEDEDEGDFDEYPEGFTVRFMNNDTVESRITAEYGIYYAESELWEAKRNVQAQNYVKQEKLNTEHLMWDMKKELIYTDKFVRITTDEEVFIGTGFESDQDFTSWTIKKPKGSFVIKDEEQQEQ
ncbi:MAG: LPS export ABC transporter periplasmic protein LptC [Bacteroidota bacterium]